MFVAGLQDVEVGNLDRPTPEKMGALVAEEESVPWLTVCDLAGSRGTKAAVLEVETRYFQALCEKCEKELPHRIETQAPAF